MPTLTLAFCVLSNAKCFILRQRGKWHLLGKQVPYIVMWLLSSTACTTKRSIKVRSEGLSQEDHGSFYTLSDPLSSIASWLGGGFPLLDWQLFLPPENIRKYSHWMVISIYFLLKTRQVVLFFFNAQETPLLEIIIIFHQKWNIWWMNLLLTQWANYIFK